MGRHHYKILLVDDEADLLRLWKLRLESKDYEVAGAESGEEALALFVTFKPDVVLTDLRMPGIDSRYNVSCIADQSSSDINTALACFPVIWIGL